LKHFPQSPWWWQVEQEVVEEQGEEGKVSSKAEWQEHDADETRLSDLEMYPES
jgi:hypothetical protein